MNYQRFLLMLSDIWENWITSTWVRTTSLFSEMEPSLVSTESLDYLFMITRFTGSTEMLSMDLSSKILFVKIIYRHSALAWNFFILCFLKCISLQTCLLSSFRSFIKLFSRDLLRLSLVRNHLTEVPSDALIILKNLNQLDLTDNKISSLHRGVFEGIAMILL